MEDTKFQTSDTEFSAVLVTIGQPLKRTFKKSDYIVFEFDDTPTVQKAYQDYLSNTLKIPARSLLENLRQMRILFHQWKRREVK